MKVLIYLSEFFKEQLDTLFTQHPGTTYEGVVEAFTDKFVHVRHIGNLPAEEAANACEMYTDLADFMCSHDGHTPDEYYRQHYMHEDTAKYIVEFYKNENGIERSLKELAYYLYRNNALHFGNLLRGCRLVPISKKHLRGKTARDYIPVNKLHRPRYFQVCYKGEKVRQCRAGVFAAVIQPDSRKNEYIEPFGPGYFVLNPYIIFRPV